MLAILTPLMSWSSVCLLLGNSTSRKTSENTDFLSEYLCLLTHGGFIQGSKKCFNNTVWHLNIAYKIEKNRISSPCIGHNVIHWIDNWVLFSLSRIWLHVSHCHKNSNKGILKNTIIGNLVTQKDIWMFCIWMD